MAESAAASAFAGAALFCLIPPLYRVITGLNITAFLRMLKHVVTG
jgi:hypothetical protein